MQVTSEGVPGAGTEKGSTVCAASMGWTLTRPVGMHKWSLRVTAGQEGFLLFDAQWQPQRYAPQTCKSQPGLAPQLAAQSWALHLHDPGQDQFAVMRTAGSSAAVSL